jgi:hypothetical protein
VTDLGEQQPPAATATDRPSVTNRAVEVRRGHVEVVHHDEPLASPAAPRRWLAVALGAGLALVLVVTLALMWAADDDTVVGEPAAPAAPAAPAPLTVEAIAPATVVAGQPATFSLDWADGAGIFAGTTEEWGDDVGASSVKEGQCLATDPAAPPDSGTASMTHTWTTPGSYQVRLAATTYTCQGGAPTLEEASTTLTVEVVAP